MIISFILSSTITTSAIINMVKIGTLPTVDLIYITKIVFGTFIMTVIIVPAVAMVDFFIVKSAQALFNDFKEADMSGRIILIIVCIVILLRKFLILTR